MTRFGDFELDEQRLELRLRGKAIELQPLVFQLLCYLVRHSDRVVTKNELLENLWPDAHVTESSLQRVVSLARSALRTGGMEDALKNFPRAGYRFMAEIGAKPPAQGPAALEAAADEAKWQGQLAQSVSLLEQALAQYRAAADNRGAARVAIRLARVQEERREIGPASGWLALAGTLLRDVPRCREHGLHCWMASQIAFAIDQHDTAMEHALRTYEIARELGDTELEALALAARGHALMGQGDMAAARACHEEAVALTLSGAVSPEPGGFILCSVITSAANRADWGCASQWTEQFTRWCERHGKPGYPGLCQLHRAEVLHFKGDLPGAREEIEAACRMLREAAPWAEGDAWRVLGDIQLAQGALKGAEQAYQRAYTLGWEPQPGLAWMHMARGNTDAAISSLERAIESANWYNRERRTLLLSNLVALAAAAGLTDRAQAAMAELERRQPGNLPAQSALMARARSRLAIAQKRYKEALADIQKARLNWLSIGATLEAALEHLEAGLTLKAMGDKAAANLEFNAAAETFKSAGAKQLQKRCEELRK